MNSNSKRIQDFKLDTALTYQAELLPPAERRISIFVEAGVLGGATFCSETEGLT